MCVCVCVFVSTCRVGARGGLVNMYMYVYVCVCTCFLQLLAAAACFHSVNEELMEWICVKMKDNDMRQSTDGR